LKNRLKSPKLNSMSPFRSRIFFSLALALLSTPLLADNPGQDPYGLYGYPPNDLYTSTPGESLGISIPSGAMTLTPSKDHQPDGAFTTTPAATGDTTNYLGCGGVGQGDYTTALFSMPEVFTKFQTDVNSTLAKQILTMNYSMPQTAALFDTLNTYGNQRYLQFQQGCSLDALKQDAKRQYLTACMTTDLINKRKQYVQQAAQSAGSSSSGGSSSAGRGSAVTAMAYAQALEICNMQYATDSDAVNARTQSNKGFADEVRQVENINAAIRPLLCNTKQEGTSTGGNGCWAELLLPQVRMCHDNSLEGGCGDGTEYGVREPLLPQVRFFDTLRFIMDDIIVNRRVLPLIQKANVMVGPPAQRKAANGASIMLSVGGYNRNAGSDIATTGEVTTIPDTGIRPFQLSFLNCKDADILTPVKYYMANLNMAISKVAGATQLSLDLPVDDIKKAIARVKVDGMSDDDFTSLEALMPTALGCAANQNVPIFDPNLTASLTLQCGPMDRVAFYSMAGSDVALVATRNVYRYLALRLKQVYGQLISQGLVPVTPTTAGTASSSSTGIVSPELNRRLANAVKEIMLPAVEAQIARLDEINQTRGDFAKRVEKIYNTKTGCVGLKNGKK
jgi:hypothetical protein